ncbi:hypothetical protein [Parasitella parasitica]|uniref:Transposase Tc1-like domain-containing protein n=1 Tax=Parasitella parasitica TaxID=35722 RepID=A0A0B7MXC7_9FUNG|nr:hypothetical protein [Parasitella parasitica]
MTSTDITDSNLKARKQPDDYTCGLIIGRYLVKQNSTQISRVMDIPKFTITDCVNRHSKTGTEAIRAAVCLVHRTHKDAGINIHPRTLSIYARRNGFGSYNPASLLMLTPLQIKKRLAWAREKMNWTADQWRSVIWPHESKFNVNGSDGRIRVIRKEGERFSPDHIHETVRFGNGSIMIWGCFWAGVWVLFCP